MNSIAERNIPVRGSSVKFILRNAIAGIVPDEIRLCKDKLGFAPPEALWMRGPLRPWIDDILRSYSFRQRGWLNSQVVNRVWKKFLAGSDELHSLIWRWISWEVWTRVFLDRGGRI